MHIEDGLLISVLSLIKNVEEPLCVYILTVDFKCGGREFKPVNKSTAAFLDERVRQKNSESFVKLIDVSENFKKELPIVNMKTRFTPCCMLRLYADELEEIPDKILYLDNDVVCRRDITDFYNTDLSGYELAGIKDYYGRFFFRKDLFHMDYLNSGVLLLNMAEIKKTGLFSECRKRCREVKMFMPDQSAINKLCQKKLIMDRKYNDQRKLHEDTVLQHFTTSFRFFPLLRVVTVKPWQVDLVHERLKLHEYDDLLDEYQALIGFMKA